MASRMMLAVAGLVILGLILLTVGAVIEPSRDKVDQTGQDPNKIHENAAVTQSAESLIAIGLTLIAIGVGFALAWAAPTSATSRMGD